MLKIKPRTRYRELTAAFALMLGISGGATIALNNQPGYDVPRTGSVAGVSDQSKTEGSANATGSSGAPGGSVEARADQVMNAQSPGSSSSSTGAGTTTSPSTSGTATSSASTTQPAASNQPVSGGSSTGGTSGGTITPPPAESCPLAVVSAIPTPCSIVDGL